MSVKVDRDTLALANRLSTEIERMRSDIKDAERQISSDIKELEDAFEVFLGFPDDIKERLDRINLETQLNAERIWELRGDPVKVLLAQFFALDGAMRANDSKSTKAVLERMKDSLSTSVLPSGKKIPPKVLEALQKSFVQARDSGPLGEASVILDLALVAEILELLGQASGTDSV